MIRNLLFAAAGIESGGDTPIEPPTAIGEFWQGGYYFGKRKYADGDYWMVLSDKNAVTGDLRMKKFATADTGTFSVADGKINTALYAGSDYPAAEAARAYRGGGFNDWYLPARDEVEQIYRNFKPTTAINNTGTIPDNLWGGTYGVDANAIPPSIARTTYVPTKTTAVDFLEEGSQVWNNTYLHSSTQCVTDTGNFIAVNNTSGTYSSGPKTLQRPESIRLIRRVKIPLPTEFGQPFQGGYYAGVMNYGVEGENYWLIVADKSAETSGLAWKTTATVDAPNSLFDGQSNCLALNTTDYPAIIHCLSYVGGGNNDWYMPSRDELELCYRNFRPGVTTNSTTARAASLGGGANGENPRSVPIGMPYTGTDPGVTSVSAFLPPGVQSFSPTSYWTSTTAQSSSTVAGTQRFNGGLQITASKTGTSTLVRPVRRVLIPVAPTPEPEIPEGSFVITAAGPATPPDGIQEDYEGFISDLSTVSVAPLGTVTPETTTVSVAGVVSTVRVFQAVCYTITVDSFNYLHLLIRNVTTGANITQVGTKLYSWPENVLIATIPPNTGSRITTPNIIMVSGQQYRVEVTPS